jgi:hypothetical protein
MVEEFNNTLELRKNSVFSVKNYNKFRSKLAGEDRK